MLSPEISASEIKTYLLTSTLLPLYPPRLFPKTPCKEKSDTTFWAQYGNTPVWEDGFLSHCLRSYPKKYAKTFLGRKKAGVEWKLSLKSSDSNGIEPFGLTKKDLSTPS
jgi:hypothetical protein